MDIKKTSFLEVLLLLVVMSLGLGNVYAAEFVVKDIRVEGLQRISARTVFNNLPVKIGDTVDSEDTPDIIKSLYKSGFFKDIRLEHERVAPPAGFQDLAQQLEAGSRVAFGEQFGFGGELRARLLKGL